MSDHEEQIPQTEDPLAARKRLIAEAKEKQAAEQARIAAEEAELAAQESCCCRRISNRRFALRKRSGNSI
ncbi:hypothetical protein BH11PAT3_BH11PAT3_3440 [soil metagenome]